MSDKLSECLFKTVDEFGIVDHIRISDTHIGKGIFATRPYPASAIIGEITGEILNCRSYGSSYSFDLENGSQLEPYEPFRYVNHSCDPNCEFDWFDETDIEGRMTHRVFLSAMREIEADEQFTIDYNWPASCAIRCDCRSPLCRGWVVADYELPKLLMPTSSDLPRDTSFADDKSQ